MVHYNQFGIVEFNPVNTNNTTLGAYSSIISPFCIVDLQSDLLKQLVTNDKVLSIHLPDGANKLDHLRVHIRPSEGIYKSGFFVFDVQVPHDFPYKVSTLVASSFLSLISSRFMPEFFLSLETAPDSQMCHISSLPSVHPRRWCVHFAPPERRRQRGAGLEPDTWPRGHLSRTQIPLLRECTLDRSQFALFICNVFLSSILSVRTYITSSRISLKDHSLRTRSTSKLQRSSNQTRYSSIL